MLPGLMQQIAEMIFLRCVRFQPQRFKGLFRLFRQVAQEWPRIRYLKRLRLNRADCAYKFHPAVFDEFLVFAIRHQSQHLENGVAVPR